MTRAAVRGLLSVAAVLGAVYGLVWFASALTAVVHP